MFALLLGMPLAAEVKIVAFAGSTREGSYNKKLVEQAAGMARQMGASVTVIDLGDYPMPFYNADSEITQGMPSNAKRFRQLMINSDALIIAAPEYNGSIPAILKNVIDWTSRSEDGKSSREAFKGKKFAIMSTSPGGGGGKRGLDHLRSIIESIGGQVVALQVAIPESHKAFNENGDLVNAEMKKQLQQEIQQLLDSKKT